MNNLSWFLYLVQVADNLQGVLIAVCSVGGIMLLAGCIGYAMSFDSYICKSETGIAYRKAFWRRIGWIAVPLLLVVVMPSRQTLLLIAGSEIGERIVKSDAVKDIVNPGADLLKAWIKEETDKITTKKK